MQISEEHEMNESIFLGKTYDDIAGFFKKI